MNISDQRKLCLGCGIILESNTVFFTANGKEQDHLSVVHSFKIAGDIYPTITMHNRKSTVGSNFGSAPFMFDILSKVRNCISINEARADSVAFNSCDTIPIIKEYLANQGYLEALEKMVETDRCSGIDSKTSITGNYLFPFLVQISNCGFCHSVKRACLGRFKNQDKGNKHA